MLFEIAEIGPVLEEVGSGAVLITVGGSAAIGLHVFELHIHDNVSIEKANGV